MPMNPRFPSYLRPVGLSFVLGFLIFIAGAMLDSVLDRFNISGRAALMDDLVVGIAAGFIVFVYERRRYQNVTEKLATIAAMNHHVRNALQAIVYSPYSKEQADQVRVIQDSVSRIQWALDEVLPGSARPPQAGSNAA